MCGRDIHTQANFQRALWQSRNDLGKNDSRGQKIFRFFSLFILSMSVLFFSGCNSQDDLGSAAPTAATYDCDNPTYLSFADSTAFHSFMTNVMSNDLQDLGSIPQLSAFQSLQSFYSNLQFLPESQVEDYYDMGIIDVYGEVEDPYLAAILSRKHEIKLGDMIFIVFNDYVLGYKSCDDRDLALSTLQDLRSGVQDLDYGATLEVTEGVIAFKVDHVAERIADDALEARGVYREDNRYQRRRRLRGKLFHSNWGIYTSIGAKTINYKRSVRVWFRANTDQVRCIYDVHLRFKDPLETRASPCHDDNICNSDCTPDLLWEGNIYENDASTVVAIFDWAVGFGATGSVDGKVKKLKPVKDLPIKVWRHNANGYESKSDHQAKTSCCGNVRTQTVKYKKCF